VTPPSLALEEGQAFPRLASARQEKLSQRAELERGAGQRNVRQEMPSQRAGLAGFVVSLFSRKPRHASPKTNAIANLISIAMKKAI
jgi:hypothetical protein